MMDGGNEIDMETVFNLKLQIQQLQDKINYLAGGTDAEQLAEVLMEKEEECRTKDRAIQSLDQQLCDFTATLEATEQERASLKALSEEQAQSIMALEGRVTHLTQDRQGLLENLKSSRGQNEALEAERMSLQQLLNATKKKLETTTGLLVRREAQLAGAQEAGKEHEKLIEDLMQRKKDISGRTREMKAELEHRLSQEKARYAVLEGQLLGCKREIGELKQQLYDKSRYMEETQVREKGVAQEKGRLEVKLSTLADENRKLQDAIVKITQERKLIDAVSVSNANRAAKYEEDVLGLEREKERTRLAMENELDKVGQQAQAREHYWKDRLRGEKAALEQVIAQKECQCAMSMEESHSYRAAHAEEARNMEGQIRTLTAEVNRLAEQVVDLEHQRREMEEYKQSELNAERHFRTSVQDEMSLLRRELLDQRKASQEIARVRQENEGLKEKITRQEAFLRRKIMKDKSGGGAAAVMDVGGGALEDKNQHYHHHPQQRTPVLATPAAVAAAAAAIPPTTYKTPFSSSSSKMMTSQSRCEDKENFSSQYRSINSTSISRPSYHRDSLGSCSDHPQPPPPPPHPYHPQDVGGNRKTPCTSSSPSTALLHRRSATPTFTRREGSLTGSSAAPPRATTPTARTSRVSAPSSSSMRRLAAPKIASSSPSAMYRSVSPSVSRSWK